MYLRQLLLDRRVLFIALVAISFWLFSGSVRPPISKEDDRFRRWLSSSQENSASSTVTESEAEKALPTIKVTLTPRDSEKPAVWEFGPIAGIDRREEIIRLLTLAREGNLFSLRNVKGNPEENSELVGFQIIDSGKSENTKSESEDFKIVVQAKEVENNIPLTILLRLLEEYQTSNKAPPLRAAASSVEFDPSNARLREIP